MKKRYIIIPVAALAVLGVSASVVLANDKVKLIKDNLVIEAGTELDFDVSKYVDASENKLEKLTIDTSKVDVSKLGEYEIIITYKSQVLKVKVSVTDSVAPVIEQPKESLKARVGEDVLIENLALVVDDASDYTLTFEDGQSVMSFDTTGEIKKKVVAVDTNNNKSEIELTFNVLDANAPVFEGYGTKDRTVYIEEKIDLLDGVFAKDSEDGDISDKIQVSEVDTSTLGVKDVTYTVEDSAGNKSTLKIKLTIDSVVESVDKTMYTTSSANVRAQSNADSDLVGSLGYAQDVHVTGRDKNTGWYRIDFNGTSAWVSDSYLSDTKPHVEKPTQSQVQQDTPSPSDCQSDCDCDCDCDCASDCDCSSDCNSGTLLQAKPSQDALREQKTGVREYDPYAW